MMKSQYFDICKIQVQINPVSKSAKRVGTEQTLPPCQNISTGQPAKPDKYYRQKN